MKRDPPVSIVVDSFNYAAYLRQAVDSALGQTYPATEVIVVDDGSTDGSRELILAYGDRVRPVLKDNGGQGSALNAGFRASRGELVIFLDSDDVLTPSAAERAVRASRALPGAAKVHWPLWVIDGEGRRSGRTVPGAPLAEGDLRELVLANGPGEYGWPPTSGNAWSRRFLEAVLPIPEAEFRTCPDLYLSALAPLFGPLALVREPQGCWRVHGENNSWRKPFDESLQGLVDLCDRCCAAAARHCRVLGVEADPESWKSTMWWYRVRAGVEDLKRSVPPGRSFILVDEDQWGTSETVAARRRIPFPERDGKYWGRPADDAAAIAELERLRLAGAEFVAIAWPAFWWLECYPRFADHLRTAHRHVFESDRLVVFELRDGR